MDVLKLHEANAEQDREKREMLEAIERYRDTINDASSTRDEIKEACNEALRKAGKLIDRQAEIINALVTAGQVLGEYVTGKTPRPKA